MPKDNQIDKVSSGTQPRPFIYIIQISETNSISIIRVKLNDSALNFNITLMMKMELVSETLDFRFTETAVCPRRCRFENSRHI
jgi:hypothetical protein